VNVATFLRRKGGKSLCELTGTYFFIHLCWCNWRTFWRKKAAGSSPRGVLFLHDNAPAHRALATQKKLAYLGFQCLDRQPYSPDLAP